MTVTISSNRDATASRDPGPPSKALANNRSDNMGMATLAVASNVSDSASSVMRSCSVNTICTTWDQYVVRDCDVASGCKTSMRAKSKNGTHCAKEKCSSK